MASPASGDGMKHDIFVSYRREDRELVVAVVRRLDARGVKTWYDANVEGGSDWRETTAAELSDSGMLVVFFSEEMNNARQLKKELQVADGAGKPVVPVLIEDTRPRGGYLYDLADRNWIEAYPDPMGQVEDLVEHLARLAGRSATPAANDGSDGPKAANDDLGPRAAPVKAADYVGKVDQRGRKMPKIDILPFKWLDLVVLAVALGGLSWVLMDRGVFRRTDAGEMFEPVSIGVLCVLIVALYGMVAFPIRYFMRRRSLMDALRAYMISSAILFGVFFAAYLTAWAQNLFPQDSWNEVVAVVLLVWAVFTSIAFLIYGALSAQRALRAFRANLRKI
jgi:hypothetical protein